MSAAPMARKLEDSRRSATVSRSQSMNSEDVEAAVVNGRRRSTISTPDLKSSGFFPVYMSPSARYDIVDHMNSHYRRIRSVKATVDTSPPKSYLISSRRSSPSPSTGGGQSSSKSASRSSSATLRSAMQVKDDERRRQRQESTAIVRTSSRINYYLDALRREQQCLLDQVHSHKAYFRRRPSSKSNSGHEQGQGQGHRRPRPDLMDQHAESFSSPKRPFMPRLLRTSAKPTLLEYRWYNRAKMRSAQDVDRRPASATSEVPSDATKTDNDDDKDERHSSRSYVINGNSRSSSHIDVPNRNWRRKASVKKAGANVIENNDEDSRYLQFIVDVTNDILARGIYTNKVMKRVFECHVERRKGDLLVVSQPGFLELPVGRSKPVLSVSLASAGLRFLKDKMEEALRKLRQDLGIPDTDDGVRYGYGYGHGSGASAALQHIQRRNGDDSVNSNRLFSSQRMSSPPPPPSLSLVKGHRSTRPTKSDDDGGSSVDDINGHIASASDSDSDKEEGTHPNSIRNDDPLVSYEDDDNDEEEEEEEENGRQKLNDLSLVDKHSTDDSSDAFFNEDH